MKSIRKVILLLFFSSCTGNNTINELQAGSLSFSQEFSAKGQTSYYFSDALIYEYEEGGSLKELWLYVNPKTKQVLYVPDNEMIVGIISFPDGTYKIYGKTERGKDTVLLQKVPEVLKVVGEQGILKRIASTRIINQDNIQQKSIVCQGFYMNYLKMEGGETIHVSNQIPVNSRQIYGFCRLEGDAKLSAGLDYLSLLKPNQTITHIERKGFSLRLTNYGPNPYYLNIKN